MRFFAILIGSLFVVFSMLFMTRQWGYMQDVTEFNHPFLNQSGPWNILQVTSLNEARQALQIDPNVILELPLRVTEQGEFFVQFNGEFESALRGKKLDPKDYRGPKPYFYSYEQLQKIFPHLIKAQDFLNEFAKQKLIFNLVDSAQNVHTQFIQWIEKNQLKDNFLVHSDTDVILKSIKEEKPMWVFGTSVPEINRFLSFESIGLESATQLRSDVYISPLTIQNRPVFNQALQNELIRRKKKIILGPIKNEIDFQKAKLFKPDGLIFYELKDFIESRESK